MAINCFDMSQFPFQIIYLNGPSSSGKTTLSKALQNALEEPFLHIGIDKIIGWMPEKINDWTGKQAPLGYSWKKSEDELGYITHELQIGPFAVKIGKTFQKIVLMLAEKGYHIIIDDVAFGKEQVDSWKELLKSFEVLWVGVNAPLSVLEEREKERGNRMIGSARDQFYKVHARAIYDLEINTHKTSLLENVRIIQHFVRQNHGLSIRPLKRGDIAQIVALYTFPWSTAEKTKTLWEVYYQEQEENIRTVAILEKNSKILGYGSLLRRPECPFFADRKIPEINAIWIHENHRREGLGKALIRWLENLAIQEGYEHIGIGVGLYQDYGPAQKLYFDLGYAPEGNGITYKGKPVMAGESHPVDDDLIFWLQKKLHHL